MTDGLDRMLLWFKLRYRPDFYMKKIFEKDVELKYICHIFVTTKMEAMQQLQFSAAVSDGTCY